jgi:Tol biopolymer transport system component
VASLAVFGARFWHQAQPGQPTLVQLTSGTGLTMDPAVSPDGKLLAYVSDRADGRNLNIWIQQLAPAGTEVQLTHFDSDTTQPSFSPDGNRIVFHSTDNGGGIYSIPTIGGEPTRLARGGRNPRFSPDGQWIAYWTGVPSRTVVTGGEGGEIYVLPAGGGQPSRLAVDLRWAGNSVWSPDGKRLMVLASTESNEFAWAVVSLNGEPSIRTTAFEALRRQGFSIGKNRIPRLSQWTPGSILFSAVHGDAFNVWRMPVSDEGRSLGPAERLTSGTTLEASGQLTPSGNLIFSSLNLVQSIWSVPLDADRAMVTGELKKLTDGPTGAEPSISLDGRKLAYVVSQNARPNSELLTPGQASTFQVRVKDLSTGKESSIPDAKHQQLHPQISRDGTLLSVTTGGNQVQIFGIEPRRRLAETETEGQKVWDWSADNKRLLLGRYPQPDIYVHDISSGRDSVFLAGDGLFQAKFSPDNRAVALVACDSQRAGVGCRLFVVPSKSYGTPEKDNWIAIDHPSRWDDKPRWSPDGNLIYFVSDRDGQFCLWAQRLENLTKRPIGTPFAIYHFHDSRLAMDNVGTSALEIDVARDKVVMGLGELTGNIWSLRR